MCMCYAVAALAVGQSLTLRLTLEQPQINAMPVTLTAASNPSFSTTVQGIAPTDPVAQGAENPPKQTLLNNTEYLRQRVVRVGLTLNYKVSGVSIPASDTQFLGRQVFVPSAGHQPVLVRAGIRAYTSTFTLVSSPDLRTYLETYDPSGASIVAVADGSFLDLPIANLGSTGFGLAVRNTGGSTFTADFLEMYIVVGERLP
jgi:hypothetical protein